jgi:hypothetical protein
LSAWPRLTCVQASTSGDTANSPDKFAGPPWRKQSLIAHTYAIAHN